MSGECKVIFFYKNGSIQDPQRISMKAFELYGVIKQGADDQWQFDDKKMFTLEGQRVYAFIAKLLPLYSGFVLVEPNQAFIHRDYMESFMKMISHKPSIRC